MKKIFAIILGLSLATSALAQDTTGEAPVLRSKKGEAYLPVAGEWGLGVSANPFLDYVGNFLHGDFYNFSPDFTFAENAANNIAVFGKLMIDENTAYRVRFNINLQSNINKAVVNQDLVDYNPAYPAFTEDWQKVNTTAIVIAPGIEKRRGTTRLQGVYGAELIIGFSNRKLKYDYGNALSSDFPAPTTTDFSGYGYGNNILFWGGGGSSTVRVAEDKYGASFLVGARGFVGVEYFFAPKISIGGEFGYMVGYQTQGKSKITAETWDGANTSIRKIKLDDYNNGGVTSVGLGLDNLSGAINLLFYF